MSNVVLVAGAGGFIGGHLCRALRSDPRTHVRAVDVKPFSEWFQRFGDVENVVLDLSRIDHCRSACEGAAEVYNLAADMGGMGFIEAHRARCMLSVLINTHLLLAARDAGVSRFFFASSACVYNAARQCSPEVTPLRESDAYPADPEDGYGWEKLFSERMCRHFGEDFGLTTRVARLHNVYGPHGTWNGGREKAPAAICRKVIQAVESRSEEIAVWGDGRQTRSFLFIDDCIRGILDIMRSTSSSPVNLGSGELVTVNELVDIACAIAGVELRKRYERAAPQGVRGRSSDNTRFRALFGWEPSMPLREGLRITYEWILGEHRRRRETALAIQNAP
jgi:nucleoside-diphosphate-sugar epimerase